jgi:hypothetical protein
MMLFDGAKSEDTRDLLGYLSRKGVRLWSTDGQLHFRAPKGALTGDDLEVLRGAGAHIAAALEQGGRTQLNGSAPDPSQLRFRAPLAFSQLQHWQLYELSRRPAIRQLASATRLYGRLHIDALREAINAMVRRHDALRTRIVFSEGTPMQEVWNADRADLPITDLTNLVLQAREAAVCEAIRAFILEPINLTSGPLFGVRLLRLGEREHVLLAGMEHMISDAFSMGIFLRELFQFYSSRAEGPRQDPPPIPAQFVDYAIWQQRSLPSWQQQHSAYWDERLRDCGRVRFPEDTVVSATASGWGTIPVVIGKAETQTLKEWCRSKRTTLVMAVFTAYAALVLRWCGVSDMIIQYQADGRVNPKTMGTIGYFAAILYLRIQLRSVETVSQLLDIVTREYCAAYEHADFSYLEAQLPRPGYAYNTAFNWIPQASSSLTDDDLDLAISPVEFAHPMLDSMDRDNEPVIVLTERNEEIVGGISYPLNRFSRRYMDRFVHSFVQLVHKLPQSEHPAHVEHLREARISAG